MDEKKPEPTKLQTDYTFERMQNEIDRLTTENNRLKRENIDSSNVLFANTNACQALQAEIAEYKITCPKCTYSKHKELQAELAEAQKKPEPGEFTKKWRYLLSRNTILGLTSSLEACDIIDRLTAELKAKDKEIVRLQPFERFYRHIYQHLKPGDEVICKICGKSMDQIEQSPEGE